MAGTLLVQAFHRDLVKSLYPKNEFYQNSKNDTMFVNSDVVNLPSAGTDPAVVANRTIKGVAAKRTDLATKYSLAELSTDPTWLQMSEELLVSYDKRASILEAHKNALNTAIADRTAYEWGLGGDDARATLPVKVRTTGTARPVYTPSATGTRNAISFADVLKAITALNSQDVPLEGRCALINAKMLEDLFNITEFKSSDYVNQKRAEDAPHTFTWLGIKWYVRSRSNVFDNAGTPVIKAVGAAGAATDNGSALIWHPDFVRRAEGSAKIFMNIDDPEFYGSVFSAAVRYGAFGARADCKGIVNVIETWVT
jgi:hypothetical protein